MDKPIGVGDLVVVVRTCCEQKNQRDLGKIRRVVKLERTLTTCFNCGYRDHGTHVFARAASNGAPIWWVKRIPPLEELGDVKQDEEIKA